MRLILASSSPYRRRLLARLVPDFQCVSPAVDETPRPDEAPPELAARLALAKARVVYQQHPDALVIGSDQVAAVDGEVLGKPGGFSAAKAQLQASSGQIVQFFTGLAVIGHGREQFHVEPFSVHFRELTNAQIEGYLLREEPYDCAGSFKCEGLGIALFTRMEGDDPTSLEGLPLIALTTLLGQAGQPVI